MTYEEKWMKRSLQLAANGIGRAAPNPLVGCVITHNDLIIGEGFHQLFGGRHAEVNALNSVQDRSLLCKSTLYVNLEPCAHFGKTPPCSQLIIDKKIPRVVIGTSDPNPIVSGKGIAQLKAAGIVVIIDVLAEECKRLNKRFFTFHEQKRPYIILKWAKSEDGYIDLPRDNNETGIRCVTGSESNRFSHLWRSQEQAILVGKTTVLNDNPSLTTRKVEGKNPIRIVLDRNFAIPLKSSILNEEARTILVHDKKRTPFHPYKNTISTLGIDYSGDVLSQLLNELYNQNIQSVIVEGGSFTLQQFIDAGLWDEARVFTGEHTFRKGIAAPILSSFSVTGSNEYGNDKLEYFMKS